MTPKQLDSLIRVLGLRRPFTPYFIEFFSGERLVVSHPEAVQRLENIHCYLSPTGARRFFVASAVSQVGTDP